MGFDLRYTLPLLDLFDHPSDRFSQGLAEHGPTGLADGRQACLSPFLRTVMPQLSHQGAVRQEYEIHVPCLALATPELTITHTQMLLPVPMECLCSCPALAINFEDAMHFPIGPIGDQYLAWLGIALSFPQHHNPYRVLDIRNADTLGEIPLLLAIHGRFAPTQRSQFRLPPFTGFPIASIDVDSTIELQITDVIAAITVDMVENVGMGEVTIKGEIARNVVFHDPIDQFLTQDGVVLEAAACGGTGVLLAKAAELQRIVLARSADVVGNQVVMGNQVPLLSMIPEPAHIFNQLAVVIDEGVINRDDAIFGVASGRVELQQIEAPLVEGQFIPLNLSDPAVQAGLVGRDGKLTIDAADGVAFSNEQAGQILSEVLALGLVGKQVCVLDHQVLHDAWELNNRWHIASHGLPARVTYTPHRTTG